ncbi:folate family ECF transporter S component [Clostridiales bacterium FE2011]|nr:folate family ECF transporter S component [Clostridiales bacterium FE2011]QTE75473.1 folate family ECF transporter S component [Clostridiales bacterium FE2010]
MQNNIKLFDTPFSKEYWKQAASELKNTKTLIFAALMIALRIALKSVSIYIAADLRISIEFLVNALGAMTFGPVVAIAGAAVSDTLGALLFPSGPYFFLFIFTEIAGSLVFALFFYRTRISVTKVILSRFCTNFFVNIVLQTPIMYLYYQMMLGKTYKIFNLPRMIKNLVLFPVESLLLVLFLRALIPPLKSLGYKVSDISNLHFTKKNIVTLVILTIIGVAAVVIYVLTK